MRRAVAIARALVRGVFALAVFALALVFGALVHLDLPLTHRIVEQMVDELAKTPDATARVRGISRLTWREARASELVVEIPIAGRLRAENVAVETNALALGFHALFDRPTIALGLTSISSDVVDFEVRPGPAPPREPPSGARGVLVEIGRMTVAHAFIHGVVGEGEARLTVDVDLDGVRAAGVVDPWRARGTVSSLFQVRRVFPTPIVGNVDVSATLPFGDDQTERYVRARSSVRSADVTAFASGTLSGDRCDGQAEIPETTSKQLRSLWPDAPILTTASLRAEWSGELPRADVRVEVTVAEGTLDARGTLALDIGPLVRLEGVGRNLSLASFVAGAPGLVVPPVWLGFDYGPEAVRAKGHVDEDGVSADVSVSRNAEGPFVFSASATARSLAGIHWPGRGAIHGHGTLRAEGELEGTLLSASLQAEAVDLRVGDLSVRAASVEAQAEGPLGALAGKLSAESSALAFDGFELDSVTLLGQGTAPSFDFTLTGNGRSVEHLAMSARVSVGRSTRASAVSLDAEQRGSRLAVRVPEATVDANTIEVPSFTIEGLGEPVHGAVRSSKGDFSGRLTAPMIDLSEIGSWLGLDDPGALSGKASCDLLFATEHGRARASGRAGVVGASFRSAPTTDAVVAFEIDGADVEGSATVATAGLGRATVELGGRLGRPSFGVGALTRASGSAKVEVADLSIGRICSIVPCPKAVAEAVAWTDARLGGRLEVVRGDEHGPTDVHLRLGANDKVGRLVYWNLDSAVNVERLLATREIPLDAPLETEFGVDIRPADTLPAGLHVSAISGSVGVHGALHGTIGQPSLAVEVIGRNLRPARAGDSGPEFDLEWSTTYDGTRGDSRFELQLGPKRVVGASIEWQASLAELLTQRASGVRWTARGEAELDRLPLTIVPAVVQTGMMGWVSGRVLVNGIHERPEVHGSLTAEDLRVGQEDLGSAVLSFEADERRCLFSIDAEGARGSSAEGSALLRASAGCHWKNRAWPALDRDAPVDLALDATRFPLSAFRPIAAGVIERLSGRLDAHARASGNSAASLGQWRVEGSAHVTGATLLPHALGRVITNFDATASTDHGAVRVDRFSGDAGTGSFKGSARFEFRDEALASATGELHVARRHAIPITLQGVSYGTIWGDVFADARRQKDEFLIELRAPTLRAELPPQRTANLETLQDNPAVIVLQPLSAPPDGAVGGGPGGAAERIKRAIIGVSLGDNVGISREDMKIELTTPPSPGNLKLTYDGEVTIDGAVRILGGRVTVGGRVFQVERGIVRFGGDDPADPVLDVDAVYQGGDTSGTRISVHVGGTAKNMKLTLQSSPSKSQSELLGILAFGEAAPAASGVPGTKSGTDVSGGSAVSSAAAGVGSAILTTGINQLLSQSVIPIRTSVSAGTSTAASASLDISERLRIEYIRNFVATSQLGRQMDLNLFAFNWRFKPRWMLRTIVGDRGTTSLDVLWQRWY
ncbi:MAG TPA: translocation/assembly module TamB domain-containing protein [Polyangiaceae bacterium]|nr:translocation/assembly module TamB domain-containing protein [Polyangiaceae bacterium]